MGPGTIAVIALMGCVEGSPGASDPELDEPFGTAVAESTGRQEALPDPLTGGTSMGDARAEARHAEAPGADGEHERHRRHPRCGDVLTRDTRLTRDIGPCEGDGLILGRDGVELDCDGHRILGAPGSVVGVRAEGVEHVEVEHCRIEGFEEGIRLQDVEDVEIEDNALFGGDGGSHTCVFLIDGEDVALEDNEASECRGFYLRNSEDLEVEYNEVEDGELGFVAFPSVFDSTFRHNRVRRSVTGFVIGDSADLRYAHNHVAQSGTGFEFDNVVDLDIEDNVAVDNSTQGFFLLVTSESRFEDNRSERNGESGFFLQGATENDFEDNEADDNGQYGFFLQGASANHFEDNDACDNGSADLYISATATGNDFDDNDFCVIVEE